MRHLGGVLALAGALIVSCVGGCSETVSHEETVTHKPDGTKKVERETVKEDGTTVREKETVTHQ